MKVGLLTLYGNTNNGNRLQNYAVQQIISKYAEQVDTLIWEEIPLKTKISLKIKKVFGIEYIDKYEKKRRTIFEKFNEKYIHTRKVYKIFNRIPKYINAQYDYFVVGSDQVWNPEIRRDDKEIFFLRFCEKKKRIAFSPSIGISKISVDDLKWFKEYLCGFLYLSCREKAGCQIMEELTNTNVNHLIDPTLVLNKETWHNFAQPIRIPTKYLLLCMLGEIRQEVYDEIVRYSKEYDLRIISIFDKNSKYYYTSPQNFVFLIENANLVITDSYHACAFSINFQVPFIVLDRSDKSNKADNHTLSRISSILEVFKLENHYLTQNDFKLNQSYEIDSKSIENILSEERNKVFLYLNQCFGKE